MTYLQLPDALLAKIAKDTDQELHGAEFHRVTFPAGSPRGGLLGQGSLLTITVYANRTSPRRSREVGA